MSWTAFHRRADVLRDLIDHLDHLAHLDRLGPRDDHHLSPALLRDRPGVAETFRDHLDLIGALQMRWSTRLSARLDDELARHPDNPDTAVRRARATTAAELPGVRAVLDRQLADPETEEIARALARASAKEQALVAAVSTMSAVAAGSQPAGPGRRDVRPTGVERVPAGSAAFVARLKAALAAA